MKYSELSEQIKKAQDLDHPMVAYDEGASDFDFSFVYAARNGMLTGMLAMALSDEFGPECVLKMLKEKSAA